MKMTPERRKELEECLSHMQAASNEFYGSAIRSGNHSFIEFTGLINEYIQLCARALQNGIDFTKCNIHNGGALPIQPQNALYLAEKLGCIYGAGFAANPSLVEAFRQSATQIGDESYPRIIPEESANDSLLRGLVVRLEQKM
jgi:hypothetical protein